MRTKAEIFGMFERDYIKPGFGRCLERLEHTFQESKDGFREYFAGQLQQACSAWREGGPQYPWAYLCVELLRTRMRQGDYRCRLMAYAEPWYFGEGREAGEVDAAVILGQYHELEAELKQQAKRYGGRVSELETEEHMAYLLPAFHEYVKELVLYAIAQATETPGFKAMEKAGQFQIRVGECLEPGYLVYMENRDKDRDGLLEWIKKNEKEAYCYQDFRGLDLAGADMARHDFRYTDFRDAVLEKADLSLGLLLGARFQRADLRGCRMAGSMLHGADFTGADLREAQMEGSLMYDGKDAAMDGRLAGFPEGKFCNADLRGADFRRCVYCGADFRGAQLGGADFTGAALFRCRFT